MSKVSVIMPVYNSEKYIKTAIDSVLTQSYYDFELIVIDDASSDNSEFIIDSYNDSRIIFLKNKKNLGVSFTRNLGIQRATGKYIAFLDSDDEWLSDKLSIQVRFMKKNNVLLSHSSYNVIDHDSKLLSTIYSKKVVTQKYNYFHNFIGNLSGMYDAEKLGKFYQKNIKHEDYIMWLDILEHTNSFGLNNALANYRVHNNNMTSNPYTNLVWYYKALRHGKKISFIKSIFFTLTHALISSYKKCGIK